MNRNDDNNESSRIPESDPSKPMNSKRDVDQSPDEKTSQDFPGYPHYPAKEDMMGQESGFHRVDAKLEDMGTGPNASGVNQRFLAGQNQESLSPGAEGESDDLAVNNSTEDEIGVPQNVTNDDLATGDELPGPNMTGDSKR